MTFLFTVREGIKKFYQKYQIILHPIGKFLFCFAFFWSLHQTFQYSETAGNMALLVGFSFLCMWLSLGTTFFMSIAYIEMELFPALPEIGILYAVFFLVIYLLYIRFQVKSCIPILIIPIAMSVNIPYIIPIIVGLYVGTVGIVPMILGLVLYFFSIHVKEMVALLSSITDTNEYIQVYRNLFQQLFQDKKMLLMICVFAVVAGVVWGLSRSSHADIRKVSIYLSGVIGAVLFLAGGYVLEVEMTVLPIVIGFGISILIGVLLQFFKGTLDFSRVEYTQFEDDNYYYYVKAVPKVSVAQREVSVKKINTRKNEKKVEEVK